MSDLSMAFASGLYDSMQALLSKEVKAAGIELNLIVVNHP